ncbi:MAG: radical SAM family heme chaperone HemW, partial [Halanaerobiales bacterium]
MLQQIIRNSIKEIDLSPGLYLHIPFCRGKCRYCDFYSVDYDGTLMTAYVDRLLTEIRLYSGLIADDKYLPDNELYSIYLGGGTPGLLPVNELERIFKTIFINLSLPVTGEITLEANPYSLSEAKLAGYKKAGVNRISLGVQSLNNKELFFLGRKHDPSEAVRAVELVKKYFKNYNLDLIFAVPGQTLKDWRETLQRIIGFSPPHISLYNLQIEEGTPLMESLERGDFQKVDSDLDAEMYLFARDFLIDNGYCHYEISNFAIPGQQSRHNRLYWEYRPYLGLGPAAHSFTGKFRYRNPADLKAYLDYSSVTGINRLDRWERMTEMIF